MSAKASPRGRNRRSTPPAYPDKGRPDAPGNGSPAADGGLEAMKRRLLRLALDVHDGPMQNLAVIGFSLGDLRRRMSALVPEEHKPRIDDGMAQISAELGRVESELRALIVALEEGVTQSVPLKEALETELREFERRCPTRAELIFDDDVRVETDSQRIALQSVTRSALANVVKHAQAEHVTIRVEGGADSITLEVEDDGCGFQADGPPKPGRFGLVGMKERVELLGGELKVESRPGGPTRVTATLKTWRPSDVHR
jgi:signal transduction histidine kinase